MRGRNAALDDGDHGTEVSLDGQVVIGWWKDEEDELVESGYRGSLPGKKGNKKRGLRDRVQTIIANYLGHNLCKVRGNLSGGFDYRGRYSFLCPSECAKWIFIQRRSMYSAPLRFIHYNA